MEFPCIYPVKVMGANQDDFEQLVMAIIQKHAVILEEQVTRRPSQNSRFVSLTVPIQAKSQAQLDALYGELSAHERVLMLL